MTSSTEKYPLCQSVAVGQKALGKEHFSLCSLPAATAKICSFTSNNGPWKSSTARQIQHPLQPNNQRLMPGIRLMLSFLIQLLLSHCKFIIHYLFLTLYIDSSPCAYLQTMPLQLFKKQQNSNCLLKKKKSLKNLILLLVS